MQKVEWFSEVYNCVINIVMVEQILPPDGEYPSTVLLWCVRGCHVSHWVRRQKERALTFLALSILSIYVLLEVGLYLHGAQPTDRVTPRPGPPFKSAQLLAWAAEPRPVRNEMLLIQIKEPQVPVGSSHSYFLLFQKGGNAQVSKQVMDTSPHAN